MGYDVHITRKENWSREDGDEIELHEWAEFVESSSDLKSMESIEAETSDGLLKMGAEGSVVWLDESSNEKLAFLYYSQGNIQVKNPEDEVLRKMYEIAQSLGARVQGDEGELYNEHGQSNREEQISKRGDASTVVSKKWWQFWK